MHGSDSTSPATPPRAAEPHGATASPFPSDSDSTRFGSRLSRRRAIPLTRRPTSRTIVGGLLVTAAALAAYLAATGANSAPQQTMVIANRAIAAGERLDASALATVHLSRNADLATHTFARTDALSGAVTLAPIAEGELVQRSAIATSDSPEPAREFSFPVDRDRALNGELRAGERVDVLATYGSGTEATTMVLARDARVVRINEAKTGALSSAGKLIVTLALVSADQMLDTAHAAQVADITLVRSTLAGDGSGTRSSTTGPLARTTAGRP